MPKAQRKVFSADFKAKVALEAVRGRKTINEIATEFSVHPNQISQWKKQVLDEVQMVFSTKRDDAKRDEEVLRNTLYQQIGQLKVELDWLKKKSGLTN